MTASVVSEAVGPLLAVLATVGFIAAGVVVYRASTIRATLELLRGEVADLTAANARLTGENVQLRAEVDSLRHLITGRDAPLPSRGGDE